MIKKRVKQIESWDKKYVWHPFTQMRDWLKEPVTIIEKAKGNYIYDTSGKKYLDGVSSLWCNLLGHGNKRILGAMKKQMAKMCHTTFLGLSHEPGVMLAKKLAQITPAGLRRVFYSDNGSTAVEVALKMAYQYWYEKGFKDRSAFVSIDNAYHGDTLGAVSAGGVDLFHSKYKKLLFKTYRAPSPYCYRCPLGKNKQNCSFECLKETEKIIVKHQKNIAGLVIEPHIQAAGGMIVMPKGYMKGIERICRKHNILLIADEVATGFGRTGRLFSCEIENIKPDFLCLSKGITGGYLPLAATITTEKIYKAFLGKYEEFKTFFHGHTYTANPLACAAALEVIDILENGRYMELIKPKIECLAEGLNELSKLNQVGDVRQIGLMAGIELVMDKKTKKPFPPEMKIGAKICMDMRKKGFFLRPLGNVIVIMPPLSVTKSEIFKLFQKLKIRLLSQI